LVRALLAAGALCGACSNAKAFDFFGLFGSDETPPPVSAEALPYSIKFDAGDGGKALLTSLQDASSLYRLRQDAPPDGDSLARRAQSDFAPLIDALWGAGYYDATVEIVIDQTVMRIGEDRIAAVARAAEAHRGQTVVPIVIKVTPGPLFLLGKLAILDSATRAPFPEDELPPKVIGIRPGDPASANDLRAAQARMLDYFRARSHPLAKVIEIKPVVDHATHLMDLTLVIDPGPRAGFGKVTVTGPQEFPSSVVSSFIYIDEGEPYSPKKLSDTRESVRQIPALGAVRIREATALDENGNLPIFVEATDRLPYVFGFGAKISTIDGPGAQVYWQDRNLFGGAESLRLESDLFVNPRHNGTRITRLGDIKPSDLGGRFKLNFIKPALGGSRNDLLIDGLAESTRTGGDRFGGYTGRLGDVSASIRHRFDEFLSVQAGGEVMTGHSTDVLGKVNYTLVGVPIGLSYDTTDSKLDPTRGLRINASLAPYPSFLGSTLNLFIAKAQASTYYALDDDGRYILAARLGLGSLSGASLDDIPANLRFYAGGGGSVRGYRYQSLGPHGPFGFVVGGRSLFETSAELRIKITGTIGIVPFFDAGNAYTSSLPNFRDTLQMSAGLGFRYYTPIGPIRVDIAAPLNPRKGDKPVTLYVSIGQSF
jgi:translocation and assembly module TamA